MTKNKTTYKVLLNDNLIYSTQNEKELIKFLENQRKLRETEIKSILNVKVLKNYNIFIESNQHPKLLEMEQRKYEIQTIKN